MRTVVLLAVEIAVAVQGLGVEFDTVVIVVSDEEVGAAGSRTLIGSAGMRDIGLRRRRARGRCRGGRERGSAGGGWR